MSTAFVAFGVLLVALGGALAVLPRFPRSGTTGLWLEGCGGVTALLGSIPLLLGLGLVFDSDMLVGAGLALVAAVALLAALIAWDVYWRPG